MIVPDFWPEARVQRPRQGKESAITVRRFGWSETSQAEAEVMARERAEAALQRIIGGHFLLHRSEPKIPYNGADGVPIREEVLSRHGDVVITRNSYGAHCLNTPDVVFADIDYDTGPRTRAVVFHVGLLMVVGALLSAWFRSRIIFGGLIFAVLVLSYPLAILTHRFLLRLRGGAVTLARKRIDAFVQTHRDWHLRLYRTPAGLRILVLHRSFRPDDPAVSQFFSALGVDPVYARMCVNQQCFRARVSPKPWRIGLTKHLRPRPGVWPVKDEHRARRNSWIREYESTSERFASCAYLTSIGSQTVDPKATRVLELHDALSQALSRKAIA